MEDNEVKGKVTVIIQSNTKTTRELEADVHCLFNSEGDWFLGDIDMEATRGGEVEVFVVPSDDVPYGGK